METEKIVKELVIKYLKVDQEINTLNAEYSELMYRGGEQNRMKEIADQLPFKKGEQSGILTAFQCLAVSNTIWVKILRKERKNIELIKQP